MTSTIFKTLEDHLFRRGGIIFLNLFICLCAMTACDSTQQPVAGAPGRSAKITTTSPQAEPQEQPKPSPAGNTAPVEKSSEEERTSPPPEPQFYGSTYWNEELTSVYFYPKFGGTKNDVESPTTHLKFNHRDDDIWLCGDQRKNFQVGHVYRLTVTFEPNTPCVTNWTK